MNWDYLWRGKDQNEKSRQTFVNLGYSLISILFSFLLAAIIMLVMGYDPLKHIFIYLKVPLALPMRFPSL